MRGKETLLDFAMPDSTRVIQLGPLEGAAFSLAGDVYRVLAKGDQTGGVFTLAETRVLPGGGPPPHIHRREDEAFYVLEGEMTFLLDGKKIVAKAGSFVQCPRGIPHAFKNESDRPARLLVYISPPGFEKFADELAHPVASIESPPVPVTPTDIEKLLAVAPKYGIEILPPPQ